ncbi:MAG: hypothetical protein Pars2KO_10710 [Parasphingorhabdus sp.]
MSKSPNKPVVVYGASGYTGRLVCEFLRQYGIPFVAAGRDAARIQEVMDIVPGIETADYEVVAVDNTVDDLSKLLKNAQVVCNIVGPFERFGEPVVEAALATGTHYIDTTGEPAFVQMIKEKYGAAFKEAGLALSPCTAYMYAPVEIAMRIAMEDGDVDAFECVTAGGFVPTFASTQSIYSLFNTEAKYLKNNELLPWTPGKGYEVDVPGYAVNQLVHPWAGGNLPIVFESHPQVHTVRQYSGNTDRALMEDVIALQQQFEADVRSLPEDKREAALSKLVDGVEWFMPPREMTLHHRSCDIAVGLGTAGGRKVVIQSTSPYTQTGVIQAATCAKLLADGPMKPGFATACETVGHRYLLGQLKSFFPLKLTVTDF